MQLNANTDAFDEMLCFSLYSASQAMNRVYQRLLDPLRLTYPQYLVLMTLWRHDRIPMGQIGRALRLESNTLTPLLKRMEAAGLLRRTRSAEDERQVIVALTHKGRALETACRHIPGCILEATGMTADDAIALTQRISTLRDTIAGQAAANMSRAG